MYPINKSEADLKDAINCKVSINKKIIEFSGEGCYEKAKEFVLANFKDASCCFRNSGTKPSTHGQILAEFSHKSFTCVVKLQENE